MIMINIIIVVIMIMMIVLIMMIIVNLMSRWGEQPYNNHDDLGDENDNMLKIYKDNNNDSQGCLNDRILVLNLAKIIDSCHPPTAFQSSYY